VVIYNATLVTLYRAYNETFYSNDKSVAQTSNGNANKGRYRQADADKPGVSVAVNYHVLSIQTKSFD
jgi:hypothetical protein